MVDVILGHMALILPSLMFNQARDSFPAGRGGVPVLFALLRRRVYHLGYEIMKKETIKCPACRKETTIYHKFFDEDLGAEVIIYDFHDCDFIYRHYDPDQLKELPILRIC